MLGDAPLLGVTQRIARRWSIQGIGMTLGAMIGNMTESRPALAEDMSGQDLLRWYWLRSELASLALSVGVAASGGKQELAARLVAHLDGITPPPAGPRRLPAPPLLAEPLTPATLIPAGQRCTQQLRRSFITVIGPSFCFSHRVRRPVEGTSIATPGGLSDGAVNLIAVVPRGIRLRVIMRPVVDAKVSNVGRRCHTGGRFDPAGGPRGHRIAAWTR